MMYSASELSSSAPDVQPASASLGPTTSCSAFASGVPACTSIDMLAATEGVRVSGVVEVRVRLIVLQAQQLFRGRWALLMQAEQLRRRAGCVKRRRVWRRYEGAKGGKKVHDIVVVVVV